MSFFSEPGDYFGTKQCFLDSEPGDYLGTKQRTPHTRQHSKIRVKDATIMVRVRVRQTHTNTQKSGLRMQL